VLAGALSAQASFITDTTEYALNMEPGYSFTPVVSGSTSPITFTFTPSTIGGLGVSGFAGTVSGATSITVTTTGGAETATISGDWLTVTSGARAGQALEIKGGFIGYITMDPLHTVVDSVSFAGGPALSVSGLTAGVDRLGTPVPEPSTYLAGLGALSLLGLHLRRNRA